MATGSGGAWAYLSQALRGSARLRGIVGARIYREAAPQTTAAGATTYPLVVCSFQSATGTAEVGGPRAYSEPLYLVRCIVDDADQSALAAAAAAIEAALGVTSTPEPPVVVEFADQRYSVQSWWERDFEGSGFEQGVRYDSAGAFYRLLVQAV